MCNCYSLKTLNLRPNIEILTTLFFHLVPAFKKDSSTPYPPFWQIVKTLLPPPSSGEVGAGVETMMTPHPDIITKWMSFHNMLHTRRFKFAFLNNHVLFIFHENDITILTGTQMMMMMMMKMMMMMMMMINCFGGMVDGRKAFSPISIRYHCQRSSSSQISDTLQWTGFEPV